MPESTGNTESDAQPPQMPSKAIADATTINIDGRGRATFVKDFRRQLPSQKYVLYLHDDGTITGHPA